MVKTQVESQVRAAQYYHFTGYHLPPIHSHAFPTPALQIKVRDLSGMSVTASPADFNSWQDVRNELMSEAKKGLKARVEAEIAAAKDGDDLPAMRVAFSGEERDIEHAIDHEVHTFSCTLDVDYNVNLHDSNKLLFIIILTTPSVCLRSSSPSRAAKIRRRVESVGTNV